MLEMQVVFEFRVVFGRQAAVLGALHQLGYALLEAIGGTESDHASSRAAEL
jgi:hypothetical protein